MALSAVAHPALRERIASLTPEAQAAALTNLTNCPSVLMDADHLTVTERGDLLFTNCATRHGSAPVLNPMPPRRHGPVAAAVPINSAPEYSSRPGAPNTFYLDFNGETISGTNWSYLGESSWIALPFDTDSDPTTFSDAEQDAIFLIWQRVAEDFRVFDVNITTVNPVTFGPRTGRALITRKQTAAGTYCPYGNTAGGVAYVNVFANANYQTYSPAWVYYDALSSREDYIAEATSHEIGHNLGLAHDGSNTTAYYPGHGPSGYIWAPLMGTGYDAGISQWSKGEYANANNTQDDLAIITGKLSLIGDVHGDTTSAATNLVMASGGSSRSITAFTSMINTASDSDLFSFISDPGTVSISVTTFAAAGNGFVTPVTLGANLDVLVDILDGTGAVVAGLSSGPADQRNATISGSLPTAGNYFLRIRSNGNRDPLTDGFSTYGSIGSYRVTGSVPLNGANLAPSVGAGPDQTIVLPATTATLAGTVSDDGQPGATLSQTWTVDSGPGAVSFSNAGALDPIATFSLAGSYVLRLTATDGAVSVFDTVAIEVAAPVVASVVPAITVENREEGGSSSGCGTGSVLGLLLVIAYGLRLRSRQRST